MRAECSIFVATSLDGFIARSDGRIDWLSVVERQGEDYGYKRFFDAIDTIVMGRKTYETVLGFGGEWPYASKRCIVLTSGKQSARFNAEFCTEEPTPLVDRLTSEGAKRIYVDGGVVIQSFLAAGLVTDMTISIVPLLLGDGVRLFGKTGADVPLSLVRSRSFDSGLVQLEYGV
jgi:dihydrofolate reductase